MTDQLANDMLHAAGHAHMDIAGQYDAPAMRAAIAAALRVLGEHGATYYDPEVEYRDVRALAARVEHPAEDGEQ